MNPLLDHYRQLWDEIHTKAANVITNEQKYNYSTWLRKIINDMNCNICKSHASTYIQNNPPENAINNLFYWSWEFHNDVNNRLNKPIMSYDDALNKYKGWSN